MNDYSVPKFDQSKIGKRIANEQSEGVPHGTSQPHVAAHALPYNKS